MAQKQKIFYGWVIAAASLVLAAAAVGLMSNSFGLFIVPICEDLGFTYAQMGVLQTMFCAGMAAVSFLWGPLFSKLNLKASMCVAAVVACVSYFLFGVVKSLALFYAVGAVASLCIGMLSWTPLTVLISNWFVEKRGAAIGIAFMGSGVGGMIFNALGGVLVEKVGWEHTFMIFSGVLVLLLVPTTFFVVRVKPEDLGLKPYGISDAAKADVLREGVSLAETLKSPRMYIICACTVVMGFCMNSCNVEMTPHLRTLGYAGTFASSVAASFMASLALGKIILGVVSDKAGTNLSSAAALGATLVMAVCMALAQIKSVLPVAVLVGGFGVAFGSVSYPLIARDLYGEKDQAAIAGVYSALSSVGSALGPTVCGIVRDATGSYTPAYWAMSGMMAVFGTVLLICIVSGSKARKKLG